MTDNPVVAAPEKPVDPGVESYVDVIQVARPRSWIALGLCGILAAGIVFWALVVTVPIKVTLPGVAIRGGSLVAVTTPVAGEVVSVYALPGDKVVEDQKLLTVDPPGPEPAVDVKAIAPGFITAMPPAVGSTVASGSTIAELEVNYEDPVVRVFPRPSVAQQLTLNAKAVVTVMAEGAVPITVEGYVAHIQPAPITARQVQQVIGDAALSELVAQDDVVQAVGIFFTPEELDKLRSAEQQDTLVEFAYVAEVTLLLGERHPISYVFG